MAFGKTKTQDAASLLASAQDHAANAKAAAELAADAAKQEEAAHRNAAAAFVLEAQTSASVAVQAKGLSARLV